MIGGRACIAGRVAVGSVLLVAGCGGSATHHPTQALLGSYSFQAEVHGENQYRNRTERFIEHVTGTIDIRSDSVHVISSHGICSRPRVQSRQPMHAVGLWCDRLGILVRVGGGSTLTLLLQEYREEPASCIRTDARGRCIERGWTLQRRQVRRSAPLQLLAS